ncbi:MAG: sulfur carrier protein ThiS [Bacteroidetes bacterium]|nr:sulfur carrier protein ThiS [Bacteroidota bacterium]MBU1720446.1 sulfur carrier protein ThiS [Bacteroidota bacterium]
MRIYVNSELHEFSGDLSISGLLELVGIASALGIAVAVNDNVIPKSQWATIRLNENDKVLIIRATQGG